MTITIIDAIVFLVLIMGAIVGFKRGVIQSAVMFIGNIVLITFAWLLKDVVSVYFYTYLPFFKFGGFFEGVSVLNILIYQALAFLVIYVVLAAVLKLLLKITGVIEKLLKYTIVLGIPSKILGAIFGLLESFIILFFALFIMQQISYTKDLISNSKYAERIIVSTPILSRIAENGYNTITEIYELKDTYKNATSNEINTASLEIMLNNNIIGTDAVEKLIEKGKIKVDNIDELLNRTIKYRKD